MYVEEVRSLFDQYIDEPDLTFLTVAQRRNALARGYDSFRQVVVDGDHWAYNKTQDFTIGSASEIDLTNPPAPAPALLGATAVAGNKLIRLRRVAILDDLNNIWQFVEAVRTQLGDERPVHVVTGGARPGCVETGDLKAIRERGVLRVATVEGVQELSTLPRGGQSIAVELGILDSYAEALGLEIQLLPAPDAQTQLRWIVEGKADLASA